MQRCPYTSRTYITDLSPDDLDHDTDMPRNRGVRGSRRVTTHLASHSPRPRPSSRVHERVSVESVSRETSSSPDPLDVISNTSSRNRNSDRGQSLCIDEEEPQSDPPATASSPSASGEESGNSEKGEEEFDYELERLEERRRSSASSPSQIKNDHDRNDSSDQNNENKRYPIDNNDEDEWAIFREADTGDDSEESASDKQSDSAPTTSVIRPKSPPFHPHPFTLIPSPRTTESAMSSPNASHSTSNGLSDSLGVAEQRTIGNTQETPDQVKVTPADGTSEERGTSNAAIEAFSTAREEGEVSTEDPAVDIRVSEEEGPTETSLVTEGRDEATLDTDEQSVDVPVGNVGEQEATLPESLDTDTLQDVQGQAERQQRGVLPTHDKAGPEMLDHRADDALTQNTDAAPSTMEEGQGGQSSDAVMGVEMTVDEGSTDNRPVTGQGQIAGSAEGGASQETSATLPAEQDTTSIENATADDTTPHASAAQGNVEPVPKSDLVIASDSSRDQNPISTIVDAPTSDAMDIDEPIKSSTSSTPAASSPRVMEEGEEELDEDDILPASDPAIDEDNDVDMEDASATAAAPTPSDSGTGTGTPSVKAKPGPKKKATTAKAKPQQATKAITAAAKKAAGKTTKAKTKVDDLKPAKKSKTSRDTPVSTRLLLYCDLPSTTISSSCQDSVHGTSVSVASAEMARQDSVDSTTDRIWCICRKRESEDDDDVMMVGCESYVASPR